MHPMFDKVPDKQMAEACNQIFVPDGGYKYASNREVIDRYGSERVFPPVPSEIVAITAAYVETDHTGSHVRRQLLGLQPDAASPAQLDSLYQKTVVVSQRMVPSLLQVTKMSPELGGRIDDVQRWCGRLAMRDGRKMLAAHVVARVVSDGLLIDTLAYPTVIQREFPLAAREAVVPYLPLIRGLIAAGLMPDMISESFNEAAGPLLHGDEAAGAYSLVAMSSFLPDRRKFKASLDAVLGPRHPTGTGGQGISRRQRRHTKGSRRK